MELTVRKMDRPSKAIQGSLGFWTFAPNENIVQNHLHIALLNVFEYKNGR